MIADQAPQIAFVSGNTLVNNHSTLDGLIRQGMSRTNAEACLKFRDDQLARLGQKTASP